MSTKYKKYLDRISGKTVMVKQPTDTNTESEDTNVVSEEVNSVSDTTAPIEDESNESRQDLTQTLKKKYKQELRHAVKNAKFKLEIKEST
jgi:hypothetical protein